LDHELLRDDALRPLSTDFYLYIHAHRCVCVYAYVCVYVYKYVYVWANPELDLEPLYDYVEVVLSDYTSRLLVLIYIKITSAERPQVLSDYVEGLCLVLSDYVEAAQHYLMFSRAIMLR